MSDSPTTVPEHEHLDRGRDGPADQHRGAVAHPGQAGADRLVLIDADGITLLAEHPDLLEQAAHREHPTVLTPHDGEFTRLLGVSHVVLTDSGGVQEEAPSLGKPVLVMRENTERPEAVTAGTVKLIGTDEERIVTEVDRLLNDDAAYHEMANAVNPYGDGKAAERSLAAIEQMFDVGRRVADFDSQA